MRTEQKIGLLTLGVSLTLNHMFNVPEFIMGLLLALALCFEIIGALPEQKYQRIKELKWLWLKIQSS